VKALQQAFKTLNPNVLQDLDLIAESSRTRGTGPAFTASCHAATIGSAPVVMRETVARAR
jgi:hypothetical protein